MEHDMEPPSHYSFIAHYSINVSLLARIKVPKGYLYGTISGPTHAKRVY
jgi:hypothetical protein